jgi:transketolase
MENITTIINLLRYDILTSTTAAGSGHPTSSLSATELMASLWFQGFFHYDFKNPHYILNDRMIFSKGHASPLLWSLFHAAGVVSYEELLTVRKFDSVLEGHPTPRFKYIDVATGSLGQGLSAGLGMALGIKLQIQQNNFKLTREPKVFVLLGDSEMAEGQVYEALQLAGHYKVNNLIGILDVNRLGQRGETMLGWDIETYGKRIEAFGWDVILLEDGHDSEAVKKAFEHATASKDKPVMIVAKTQKGHGISMLADKDNWHGKPLPPDQLEIALKEVGGVDTNQKFSVAIPELVKIETAPKYTPLITLPDWKVGDKVATREAYGDVVALMAMNNSHVIALDAETSNSTFAEKVKKETPNQFLEMYIAEQNMVSTGVGASKVGYIPFVSTFAAFFTRAFDQIRMAQYSDANINLVGSHAGVSIGPDGSSQMALEDLAMMRTILQAVVLYPSDAISTAKLLEQMVDYNGVSYMRTTREKTPIIYTENDHFPIGGSKIVRQSEKDIATIVAAGITLHEALKAYEQLQAAGINVAVVDLYSVKPIDAKTIIAQAEKTKKIIVVEDHYPAGGIGEAVKSVLKTDVYMMHLCVNKIPRSGTPEELLAYEEIDAAAIVNAVKEG